MAKEGEDAGGGAREVVGVAVEQGLHDEALDAADEKGGGGFGIEVGTEFAGRAAAFEPTADAGGVAGEKFADDALGGSVVGTLEFGKEQSRDAGVGVDEVDVAVEQAFKDIERGV